MKINWHDICANMRISNFPFPIKWEVMGPEWARYINVSITVTSATTGLPTVIVMKSWPSGDLPDEDTAAWYLRNVVLDVITHELDEKLTYNGKKTFNPH